MKNRIGQFLREEDGINTVEIVVIIAIIIGIALLFKTSITTFVKDLFKGSLNANKILEN